MCQRVWESKKRLAHFLELVEKAADFSKLNETDWLCDFAFTVDILTHIVECEVMGKISVCKKCTQNFKKTP